MPAATANRSGRVSAPVLPVLEEAPAPLVQEADPTPVEPESPAPFVPVVYYNPKILDEQFLIAGSPYKHYFNRGKYVALNEQQEIAVRNCLRAHGPDAADRWRGDDRKPYTFRRTGFTTANQNALDDHEAFHQD